MDLKPLYTLPAARGIQAGRCFYNLAMPMRVLVKLLRIDDGDTMERSQRLVNPSRARKVAQYMLTNPESYLIPCLTGVIETNPGSPESVQFHMIGEETFVGELSIPMDAQLKLFDGQHRASGIRLAIQQAAELGQDSVPLLLFVDMTLAERKMAFTDINQNVSKPAQSLSDAYNSREVLPQLAVELANTLNCFKGLVDFERNTITAKSEYLFPLKTLKDTTATLLGLNAKTTDISDAHREIASVFWQSLSDALQWGGLWMENDEPASVRLDTIKTHTVMMKAYALAGQLMLCQLGDVTALPYERLASLDYSRHSEDFMRRCIQSETGRMLSDSTAIRLTANKLLMQCQVPLTPENKQLEKEFFGWHIDLVLKELVAEAISPRLEPELQQLIGDKFVVAMNACGLPLEESHVADYQRFFHDVIAQDENPQRFNHLGVMKAQVKTFFATA
ncbi:DNA sulfur modification protein DndB [Vibrio parahaemolyticus]|uniref:DNA sulfur modification protein DndB n=1 Tax=Vibrio parahaemolyticus TaxID=670 RepID=UPI0022B52A3D|nr:DNA sulfur modification protein DndB [Vibrio parahaemolyticus]MCZ5880473.1 DNA sulfur modification protein DndB [Vibrio parahaemolyticus]MCZ6298612.1 DNA sulfur modification protein DndB [Vibrio parahaemolyticus]MCZ6371826.1 DNA sulfur modification protein DndB [Vibrio parahaemolyticus]HBN6301668.1 DNA sulfur modification protein DndB [Vibrio parahaemolyticus]